VSSELEHYLASAAAQGLFQDEGSFRIQAEKALEKLSRFTLPGPGLWVLKMVQAAVRLKAKQIEFTFERRKVKVRFDNLAAWEAESLLAEILQAKLTEDPARRHLFTGILGAALGFSQEVEWECGTTNVKVGTGGPLVKKLEQHDQFRFVAHRPWRPAIKSGLLTSPIRYLLRQTVQEYTALIEHTFVAPIAIKVDQRPLNSSYQTSTSLLPMKPNYDSDNSSGRQVMLAQIPLSGLDRPALEYPIDQEPLTTLEQPRDTFETLRLQSQHQVEGVICLYSCLQRESRLNLVMDGVCLQRPLLFEDEALLDLKQALENGKDDFVLDVYLAVSFEDLDVSQFSVRMQSFSEPVLQSVPNLRQVLITLREHCSLPWKLSINPPARVKSNPVSMIDVAGMGFFSLFIPHAIIIGGIFGTGYLAVKAVQSTGLGTDWWERRVQAAHEEKQILFQRRLDSVTQNLMSFL
jgi:hypothetical protein